MLGNTGARYSKDVISRQDALDALELAEALLDHVYVFAQKFEEFKARRAAVPQPRSGLGPGVGHLLRVVEPENPATDSTS